MCYLDGLAMTTQQLEERLAKLEQAMIVLKVLVEKQEERRSPKPWWEKIAGGFADDPSFDEAERLGREWRAIATDDWQWI
jgi:hypothetical protein